MIKVWNQLANQFVCQCLTGLLNQSYRFNSIYSTKYTLPTKESARMNQEYNESKHKLIKDLAKEMVDEHLEKDEERYQNKIVEIMEIYYSLDEDKRPPELRPHEIDYLVKMKSREIRNFIKHIRWKLDCYKDFQEKKQALKQSVLSLAKKECGVTFDEDGKPIYKMHNISTICSWDINRRMREYEVSRMALAWILNSPKVVIDFDYDEHMTVKQHITIVDQIKVVYGAQRRLRHPLLIYFCNFKPSSPTAKICELDFGNPSNYFIQATEKSYLELFPREKLVYLTADTDQVLEYNPDDVYIIGGMIDTKTNEPVSAIKSAREGIRTAKLPLEEHFTIRNEFKSLKISQVFKVLGDLHENGGDMKKALEKNIATRIRTLEEMDRFKEKNRREEENTRRKLQEKYKLTDEEVTTMILLARYHVE